MEDMPAANKNLKWKILGTKRKKKYLKLKEM